jgi:hypothetical protein
MQPPLQSHEALRSDCESLSHVRNHVAVRMRPWLVERPITLILEGAFGDRFVRPVGQELEGLWRRCRWFDGVGDDGQPLVAR